MNKILVTGASGLVGSRFVELYPNTSELLTPSLDEFNLNKPGDYLAKYSPDIVLNFAAYTDVSAAEKQKGDKTGPCWQVNVEGTRNLIKALPKGTRLIHISTDYVFNGFSADPGPYDENHEPETDSNNLTWYGFTKAEAERIVGEVGTVVRITHPVRAKYTLKLDYLHKPLDLFNQGKLYPLFTDQQVGLTFVDVACLAIQKIIDLNVSGVFNVASTDVSSPYEIITYWLQKHGKDISGVQKTLVDPKRHPQFIGLKSQETQERLGMKFSSWREIVEKLLATS